jgi:beta-lactamase superfamily II metal-dependent hydrolase
LSIANQENLRIHVVNVDHGDAILVEFADYDGKAHYGIVDTGRPERIYRDRLADYFQAIVDLRDMPYQVEFVCITHPHEDHYGGLRTVLDRFAPADSETRIRQFWDCGFRTTAKTYNDLLERIAMDDRVVFVRLAAGAEFEFGEARVYVMGPSLDLRNRFDTYGVDRNNASIVLRISYKQATAILAGDAHFDSWGKITEEFPRTSKISFFEDAKIERSEGTNQLNCQLLKVSHHGSKHGTSLEYLEKLNPGYFMITCGSPDWYTQNKPGWGVDWPHPLARLAIENIDQQPDVRLSYREGNVIYTLAGGRVKKAVNLPQVPGTPGFIDRLRLALV